MTSATRIGILLLTFAVPALAAACGEAEPPAVRVDGITYSERELLGLSRERRTRLALVTAFGLVVARGQTEALGEPFVDQGRARVMGELLAAARALDSMRIGDEMLESAYHRDPEYQLTVRHLIVMSARYETDETRAAARAKAEAALDRIRAGEDFAEVAAQVSEEPGAEGRQGLLEPGRRGAWVGEFWNAAMGLRVGEISDVVETQYGFHVLRLEGRDTVPFQDARSGVVLEAAESMGLLRGGQAGTAAEALDVQALSDSLEARGLEIPDAVAAELALDWTTLTDRWTAALGFREGMSQEQVRAAALAAFRATGQGPTMARNELEEHGEALERLVEIEVLE